MNKQCVSGPKAHHLKDSLRKWTSTQQAGDKMHDYRVYGPKSLEENKMKINKDWRWAKRKYNK